MCHRRFIESKNLIQLKTLKSTHHRHVEQIFSLQFESDIQSDYLIVVTEEQKYCPS